MIKKFLILFVVTICWASAYAQYNETEFIGNVKRVSIVNKAMSDTSYTSYLIRDYDTLGRLCKNLNYSSNSNKMLIVYRYNIDGKLSGYNMYDGGSVSAPIFLITDYVYENGRIAKEKFKSYTRDKGVVKSEVLYKYDQRGLLVEGTYICGLPGYFKYDSLGRLIESTGYEHSEELTYKGDKVYQMTTSYGDEHVYTYGDDGRLVSYEIYEDGFYRKDGHNPVVRYSYRYFNDSRGNWIHLYQKDVKTGLERIIFERKFEYRW